MNKEVIRKMIGRGDLKKAIEALMTATTGRNDESTAMMLSSRLSRLERSEMMGIMSFSDANMERNRITQAALSLLSDLKEDAVSVPQAVVQRAERAAEPPSRPHFVGPKQMFISYAREDFDYVERLKRFMIPLKRDGLVSTWSDSNLGPGQSWNEAIQQEMAAADIILYMVSMDFLASSFITEKERGWAMQNLKEKGTIIVPVIVRPCDWHGEDFAKYNAIPKSERGELTPLSKWEDQDSANMAIVNQLKVLLK